MLALGRILRPVDALEQQLEEPFLRQRRQQHRALAEIAAHGHECLQVHLALDALCNGRAAEPMGEVDDGLADRRIGRIERAVVDEGGTDLELSKGHCAQAREGGIAAAEIIDADLHPTNLQVAREHLSERGVTHDLVIGHLENDARPAIGAGPILANQSSDRQRSEHARRNVDGERKIEADLLEHRPALQRSNKRIFSQPLEAAGAKPRLEASGQHHAKCRMPQARNRLGSRQVFTREIDLWLIPELEPALAQGVIDLDHRALRRRVYLPRAMIALLGRLRAEGRLDRYHGTLAHVTQQSLYRPTPLIIGSDWEQFGCTYLPWKRA